MGRVKTRFDKLHVRLWQGQVLYFLFFHLHCLVPAFIAREDYSGLVRVDWRHGGARVYQSAHPYISRVVGAMRNGLQLGHDAQRDRAHPGDSGLEAVEVMKRSQNMIQF
jgi:hypothetical protein